MSDLADTLRAANVSVKQLENQFFSHMGEAARYHEVANDLEFRFISDVNANPAMKTVIAVAVKVIKEKRDRLVELALVDLEHKKVLNAG